MQKMPCPACGGSGGGPFGRAGGAWDKDDYECPRCAGAGVVASDDASPSTRPGIVKAQAADAAPASKNGRATGS